jgi:hypothetical protein
MTKKAQSKIRKAFDYDANPPRCGNCEHFAGTTKCALHKFKTTHVAICDAWQDDKTGERLEGVAVGDGSGVAAKSLEKDFAGAPDAVREKLVRMTIDATRAPSPPVLTDVVLRGTTVHMEEEGLPVWLANAASRRARGL